MIVLIKIADNGGDDNSLEAPIVRRRRGMKKIPQLLSDALLPPCVTTPLSSDDDDEGDNHCHLSYLVTPKVPLVQLLSWLSVHN